MKQSLSALKNLFASEDKSRENGGGNLPNNYYPFWNMQVGQRVVMRFLPDRDSENVRAFLSEKVTHKLTINGEAKTVPCLAMYGEDCPVCKVSQDYYKVKDDVNGKKYWKKKSYIAQVLIVEDPLPADQQTGETHEGKVRLVSLGFQIYNIIKEAFASDDLESVPYSFEGGYDFIIKKTEQGNYASYAVGTKFANKPRDLTEEEVAIAEEGMIELNSVLPKNPGFEKVQAMLNADLNGEAYDDGKSSKFNSPDEEFAPAPKPAPKKAPVANDDDEEYTPAPKKVTTPAPKPAAADAGDEDVEDMLAAIRARRANKSS